MHLEPREKARSRPRSSEQKKVHYDWELDDGVRRCARHAKRDRLKRFVDSDGDGLFAKADALVGIAFQSPSGEDVIVIQLRAAGTVDLKPPLGTRPAEDSPAEAGRQAAERY